MTLPWSKLSRNAKLGLLVCLLGLLAAFAGTPYKGARVTMDVKELGAIVQREVDHVTPEDLADWIIKGKADYRLIDLRNEAEYGQYHIPGAENVPMAMLLDHGLARNEKIILYSEGGIHSAQAWFLLRAKDYKAVYMLRDGLDGWKDRILFPSVAPGASPDQLAAFEKMKEVSKFFGGAPQTGKAEGNAGPALALPKLDMPAQPAPGPMTAPKKKKEGC